MKYKVAWDNGHACGVLDGDYANKRAAEIAARDWKRTMVATDLDPAAARDAYQWEIVEADG